MTYAELFAEEYLGKIFYFCLRKTGNETEAEELSSEISLEVLRALAGGAVPERFSAWVWQIAKNRYARWAERKSRSNALFTGEELSEYEELPSGEYNAEEFLIHAEAIALLRRELALIHSDYRRILVAFYIEDKKISRIADELSLPLGTVKTRLIKGRKILKEGMDMAREFGKLSYRPEQISFTNNVPKPGRNNEPWSLYKKLLPKNILLAAYRNPMTAEELSLELGVALPYLEEEIAILEKEQLLRKSGKKYETMIYIMSADTQRKIYDKLSALAPALTKNIEDYLTMRDKLYEKNGIRWNLGAQPEEDRRWARLMRAVDVASYAFCKNRKPTVRSDGGEWDIVGYEEYDGPEFTFVGQHGSYGSKANWIQYKFTYPDEGIYKKTPENLKASLADAMEAVCEGKEANADAVSELIEMGYLKKEGDTLIPQMMVVAEEYGDIGEKGLPVSDAETLRAAWKKVLEPIEEFMMYKKSFVFEEAPTYLKNTPEMLSDVWKSSFEVRGAVLETAFAHGYIRYEENDPRILLGTMITVSREK